MLLHLPVYRVLAVVQAQQSYLVRTALLVTYRLWHAVIKPIYGAASIGVVRVDNMQQLETAYKRVTRQLAKAHVVAGALEQGEEDEGDAVDGTTESPVSHVSSQTRSSIFHVCTAVAIVLSL